VTEELLKELEEEPLVEVVVVVVEDEEDGENSVEAVAGGEVVGDKGLDALYCCKGGESNWVTSSWSSAVGPVVELLLVTELLIRR
jgi:hypothetical protein